jgi:hypothetical protein
MAIYGLEIKFVSRAKGGSSVAAAAYRSGQKLVDARTGEVHDYRRRSGVEDSFVLAPAGAPSWATDVQKLWNAVEQKENRGNSQTAREFLLTLPAELTVDQNRDLVKEWVTTHLVNCRNSDEDEEPKRSVVAHVSMHSGDGNPHAHVLSTTRNVTPEGWGKKLREFKPELENEYRPSWAAAVNRHLEMAGHSATVDHRSKIEKYEEAYRRDPKTITPELRAAPATKKGKDVERLIERGKMEHGSVRRYFARVDEASEKWGRQVDLVHREVELEERARWTEIAVNIATNGLDALPELERRLSEREQILRQRQFEIELSGGDSRAAEENYRWWSDLRSDVADLTLDWKVARLTSHWENSPDERPRSAAGQEHPAHQEPERDHLGRSPEQIERDRQRLLGRDGPSLGR